MELDKATHPPSNVSRLTPGIICTFCRPATHLLTAPGDTCVVNFVAALQLQELWPAAHHLVISRALSISFMRVSDSCRHAISDIQAVGQLEGRFASCLLTFSVLTAAISFSGNDTKLHSYLYQLPWLLPSALQQTTPSCPTHISRTLLSALVLKVQTATYRVACGCGQFLARNAELTAHLCTRVGLR